MNWRLRLLFAAVLLTLHCMATAPSADSAAGAAAIPGLHVLRRVEDVVMMSRFEQGEEEEAYPNRRVLQDGGPIINNGALDPRQAACFGSCPGRGQPYTGPGCHEYYQCPG
jgi:hypothetical protein